MALVSKQMIEKNGKVLLDQFMEVSMNLIQILDSFDFNAPNVTKWVIQDSYFVHSSEHNYAPMERSFTPIAAVKRGETLDAISEELNAYLSGERSLTIGILPKSSSSVFEVNKVITAMRLNKADVSISFAQKIAALLMDISDSGADIIELEDTMCFELFCKNYSIGFITIPLADIFLTIKLGNDIHLGLKKRGVENLYNTLVILSDPIKCYQTFNATLKEN